MKIPNSIALIIFGIMLILSLIGILETFLLMRGKDKFKKGFLIYKRNLSKKEFDFVSNLQEDLVVYVPLTYLPITYSFFSPKEQGYILINDNQVFIQFRKLNWRTGLPYVGYIDLNSTSPSLEYRSSLLMHIALLLFLLLVTFANTNTRVLGLFVLGVLCLNFFIEKSAIDKFLLDEIKKSKKK